ncbi:hypothetical protein BDN72DRAFT_964347 [Pluteus cervinus]|uniref:Uncharacterized protein n=1 Tax=Pluteus cervinus TaxID=181527 RepID=A0ACD3AAT0_9AGAR|nr:hypothetical protein BDN72DRAFT_964347 [Pluteus cervinus]
MAKRKQSNGSDHTQGGNAPKRARMVVDAAGAIRYECPECGNHYARDQAFTRHQKKTCANELERQKKRIPGCSTFSSGYSSSSSSSERSASSSPPTTWTVPYVQSVSDRLGVHWMDPVAQATFDEDMQRLKRVPSRARPAFLFQRMPHASTSTQAPLTDDPRPPTSLPPIPLTVPGYTAGLYITGQQRSGASQGSTNPSSSFFPSTDFTDSEAFPSQSWDIPALQEGHLELEAPYLHASSTLVPQDLGEVPHAIGTSDDQDCQQPREDDANDVPAGTEIEFTNTVGLDLEKWASQDLPISLPAPQVPALPAVQSGSLLQGLLGQEEFDLQDEDRFNAWIYSPLS